MSEPLLLTKLYIPPSRPNVVLRPRLIERMNEGLSGKLTLISAPAGFGKTTLISEWTANCERPVAWLSLDEGDKDLVRFLSYMVAAIQTIKAGIGEGLLAALQSPQTPQAEAILTTLINEISNFPKNFLLVLDDYHIIDSQPVDKALTFLVKHQPPHMHLLIATREDPSLPLARLRARGQLTELRAADLRFTPAEATEFLNHVMGLNLRDTDISALEARTEGWIVGLQLAALSIQGRSDTASFIQAFTGSHRFILDYLVDEVLRHQPEQISSFLLKTAILDRFSAGLCNAVTERQDGKEMLDILERSNLFLIPLDDQRQWYRYHHLFAEVLQKHLMEVQPERVSILHQQAGAWYEHNGLRPDAIRHALAAKDFERAAGLIELAWPAAEEGSIRQSAWLSWVKALPEGLVLARPVLNVCYAYALLGRGELEAAQARFNDAERKLEPTDTMKGQRETPSFEMVVVDQEQWKSLPATIAVGRAYIAQTLGNIPDTVRYASRVLELTEAAPFRHSQASMLLGMSYWASGDLEAADRVFAEYTMKLREAGNLPDAISTTVVLGEIRLVLGHLQEAIRTIEQLLHYVMDQGEPISPQAADLYRELGELYLEQGRLEAAAKQFRSSKELGEKAELPVWRYRWYIAQARLSAAQGDQDRALALLDEAERLYIRTPLPDTRPISAIKARIWLLQGRLAQAMEWVREQGSSPEDALSYLREYDYLTLARILIAQYQSDPIEDTMHAVLRLLDRSFKAAEEGKRLGSVIEILALLGLAHQAQGDSTSALTVLKRALSLAEPEGYIHIFVGEGPSMVALLRDAIKHGISPTFVNQLLERSEGRETFTRHLTESALQKISEAYPVKTLLVEPLSERELDVLRLLRTELNGPEIARELVVSLNTLRTHTQHIFAKLGVNNRRAAVRRAEELDLL
jgi:LuxR family maltose regulon positive regulatory protein